MVKKLNNRFGILRIMLAGLVAGLVSHGLLGMIFTSTAIESIIYHPELQSELFNQVVPQRNVYQTLLGLSLLSILHSGFYAIFYQSIPGSTWIRKGLFWGFTLWALYWLFQDWFMFHTLLNEPVLMNLFQLSIMLICSLIEGLLIALILRNTSLQGGGLNEADQLTDSYSQNLEA